MKKTRILIVDDSALVRQVMMEIFSSTPDLEVVGTANDPYIAREEIKRLNPDVITLDVEMPRMDGVTFLRNLMRLRPMPVVMVSSLTEAGADITLNALEIGAVDFVAKPRIDVERGLRGYAEEIIAKVRAASRARVRTSPSIDQTGSRARLPIPQAPTTTPTRPSERLIVIGASTGGTEAIRIVLEEVPTDAPGIVIVQHIPELFAAPFARRLDGSSALKVKLAEDGEVVLRGHAYVAPGDQHLRIERQGQHFVCRLDAGDLVNRHRPAVDVLFNTVAQAAGKKAVGVILTGMGADGAQGLLALRAAGAGTIAQDENSSVVWGMPGQAVKLGAAESVLSLGQIAAQMLAYSARCA